MSNRPRFHLAFPVHDLKVAKAFYVDTLGCGTGRESDHWVDLNFHGHQIVAHLAPELCDTGPTSAVDGKQVPVRHFGLLLDYETFDTLADRLKRSGAEFVIEPYLRFAGQPGEQKTMFIRDPSGNALEFKAFADDAQVFAV